MSTIIDHLGSEISRLIKPSQEMRGWTFEWRPASSELTFSYGCYKHDHDRILKATVLKSFMRLVLVCDEEPSETLVRQHDPDYTRRMSVQPLRTVEETLFQSLCHIVFFVCLMIKVLERITLNMALGLPVVPIHSSNSNF